MIVFFDTETTGFANFGARPDCPSQPYLVQLGALIEKPDGTYQEFNQMVKPEGWTVPKAASDVHGFTTEICAQRGAPLAEVMKDFRELLPENTEEIIWIAHNARFDVLVMQATCLRLTPPRNFIPKRQVCTMEISTKICQLRGRGGRIKWPSLQEAHLHFTGETFTGAHDAMADVHACKAVFEHLLKLGHIKDFACPEVKEPAERPAIKLFRCGPDLVVAVTAHSAREFWESETGHNMDKAPFEIYLKGFEATQIGHEEGGSISVKEALEHDRNANRPVPYVLGSFEN